MPGSDKQRRESDNSSDEGIDFNGDVWDPKVIVAATDVDDVGYFSQISKTGTDTDTDTDTDTESDSDTFDTNTPNDTDPLLKATISKFNESQAIIEYITKNPSNAFWWSMIPIRKRHGSSKIPFRLRSELEEIFITFWKMGLNDIATALYSQLPIYYDRSNKEQLVLTEYQRNELFKNYGIEQQDSKGRFIKAIDLSKTLGIENEKSQLFTALKILDDLNIKEINNAADLNNALNKTFDWLSADKNYQDQQILEKLRKSIRSYANEIGARKQLHNFNKLDWRIKNIIDRIADEIGAKKELNDIEQPQERIDKLETLINDKITESAKSDEKDQKRLNAVKNLKEIQKAIDEERENSPDRLYGYIPDDSIIVLKRMKDVKQFGSVNESIFSTEGEEKTSLGKKSKRVKWGKVIGWGLVITFVVFLVVALALGAGGTAASFLIAHAFVKAFSLTCGVAGIGTNFILYWQSCFPLFKDIYKKGISSIFKNERGNYISKEKIIATCVLLIPCIAAAVATGFITFSGTQATVISLCLLFGATCPHVAVLAIAGVVALAGTIGLGMLFFKAIMDFIKDEKYKDVANYFKANFIDIFKYNSGENNKSWTNLSKSEKAIHILKGVGRFLWNSLFLVLRVLPAAIAVAVTIGIAHSSAVSSMSSLFDCSLKVAAKAATVLVSVASPAYAFFFSSSIIMLVSRIISTVRAAFDGVCHLKQTYREMKKEFQSTNPIYRRHVLVSVIKGLIFGILAALNAFGNGVGGKNPESTKNVGKVFGFLGKKAVEQTDQVIAGTSSFSANWFPGREVTREARLFKSREVKGVSSKRYEVKHEHASLVARAC